MNERDGSETRIPEELGPYRLASDSARFGATGVVVQARHIDSHQMVAIKIANELVAPDSTRERLEREAGTLADLGGRYAVKLVGLDVKGPLPYLVMEYVPHTIADVVAERGRLSAPVALRIVRQLAESLAYLHEHGIVHRDLSPANIGLTADLEPRLLDFGIAVTTGEEIGGSTAELGTMQYTAPERLREARYDNDPRTDLYALGCLAYFLFDGSPPFEGSHADLLERHAAGDLEMPPTVPDRVRPLIRSLLDPDPDQRLSSAREVLDAVDRIGVSSDGAGRAGAGGGGSMLGGLVPAGFGLGIAAFALLLAFGRDDATSAPAAALPAVVPSTASTPTPTATPVPPDQPIQGWSEIAFQPSLGGALAVANTETRLYLAQSGEETNQSIVVWSAPLFLNGTVGAAVEEQRLITGRDGFPGRYSIADVEIVGECLFALPGTTNSDDLIGDQPIEAARIDPVTGQLSPFVVSDQLLNTRRAGAALIAVDGYLYAIAGFQVTLSDDRRSVEYARINEDCSLGSWTETTGLVQPIAEPRVVNVGRTIYVVGGAIGDSGAQPLSVVQRATIQSDGALAPWQADPAEQLVNRRYDHDVVVVDGQIVAIGGTLHTVGSSPGIQTNSVEFAGVNDDGSLQQWREGASLPDPRARHRAFLSGDHVLVVGGAVGRTDPRIAIAERGLSTNQLLTPLDLPVEIIDAAPPRIVAISCTPAAPVVADEVTCSVEVDGRTDLLEWAGEGFAPTAGPTLTTMFWQPLTKIVSLEACNTAGCVFGETVFVVDAPLQFWQQLEPRHPASIPISGGEFLVDVAAGTRDIEQIPDVTFRVTGPGFDAELPAEICAGARNAWGASICYNAIFELPPDLVTEPTTFAVEVSAPLIDEPIRSEFVVGGDPDPANE